MQIREIITRPVQCVAPDCTLFDAAQTMMDKDLGWLPVSDDGRVVGIITDRDITIRGVAGGLDAKKAKVQEVMTREVHCCSIDDSLEDAASKMEDEQIRRLVIVDDKQKLAGVLSLADLALDTRDETSHEVLKEVSKPS
jgi:CBS domain-containing protein